MSISPLVCLCCSSIVDTKKNRVSKSISLALSLRFKLQHDRRFLPLPPYLHQRMSTSSLKAFHFSPQHCFLQIFNPFLVQDMKCGTLTIFNQILPWKAKKDTRMNKTEVSTEAWPTKNDLSSLSCFKITCTQILSFCWEEWVARHCGALKKMHQSYHCISYLKENGVNICVRPNCTELNMEHIQILIRGCLWIQTKITQPKIF